MFLEIITPDEKIFEGEVDHATFPGSKGSFQVLNDHAAMVSSLGKGDLKMVITHNKKTEETHMAIDGGVVEVLNNKVLVLAEHVEK
ncbi:MULTISPECIES: ATP synthase F1 subunit epsilon [Reichenbachiella]|uniref:F-type H+-transporting ATPase subunit epsilon n=1 Tax=Reichenbachiella agariperforans TaxID=156994 RepID=A0A1M6P4J4_REIAG|nr:MULTISPECIES: ATP synthase F1 subunit epsilon [Reichenbachiella]MBU2914672.1 ATP synthase F1 subunit epsilon [Reichenbachiella agariperforans]RJE71596.1 ATP synthase F1 subunit epsilon [Reichenbachiella sp. MSK19-1]SHK02895.1 F-type H+-transporting ATPase subunit epsilon [Reichenbachiella agariperforans]